MATKKIRPELAVLAANIENLLNRWGMTQSEFAELFPETNRATISNWTRAHSAPQIQEMYRIGQMSGITIDVLFARPVKVHDFPTKPLDYSGPELSADSDRIGPLLNDLGLRYELQKIWDHLQDLQARIEHVTASN